MADQALDTTVPGGRYIQNGRMIDANGKDLGAAGWSSGPGAAEPSASTAPSTAPSEVPSAQGDAPNGSDAPQGRPAPAAPVSAPAPAINAAAIEAMNLTDFEDYLDGVHDVATLDAIAAIEAQGKARAGATVRLDARRAQLEG